MSKKNKIEENKSLLDLITPIGLSFNHNQLKIGDVFGKVYTFLNYPSEVNIGWLSGLNKAKGLTVMSSYKPVVDSNLQVTLSNSIKINSNIAQNSKDANERQVAQKKVKDAEEILKRISEGGEKVGEMINTAMVIGNEGEFKTNCKSFENLSIGMGYRVRALPTLQKEGYQTIAPFHNTNENIREIGGNISLLSTFFGGFLFSADGFNDANGYYFARDTMGGVIMLDTWTRGNNRTNSNWVITGAPGKGKSTAVKHLIINEYISGTKIIAIDPEREYKELCDKLDGDWINCGGSKNGKINPLQIKKSAMKTERDSDLQTESEYEEELEELELGSLALHMKRLDVFFSLYLPELDPIKKAILKETLEELYKKFEITWDTNIDNFTNEQFPTLKDLYELMSEKAEAKEGTLRAIEENHHKILALLLRDVAIGSDSYLFNGYTSIETSKKMVCLDTHDLQDSSDTIKKTQYYNILTWVWEQMSQDREERVMLICDEAYLMIDPRIPQSLIFLRNIAKRCRKYNGGIVIASQDLVDFLSPEVKMYGQPLVDLANYKLLFSIDGKGLHEIQEVFKLKQYETDVLLSGVRGRAVFIVGGKKYIVDISVPEFEFNLMGSAGGN